MTNRTILLLLGLLLTTALPPATADVVRDLQGRFSQEQVKQACDKAGGTYLPGGQGSYGCTKRNCDGKGGQCTVDCKDNGTCKGSTPSRTNLRSSTPISILTNGGQSTGRPGASRVGP